MQTKRRPPEQPREPLTWRQLLAIARSAVTDDPDYGAWRDRVIRRLIALHFEVPSPATLTRALAFNAHLLPPPLPLTPPAPRPERHDPTRIPRTREALTGRGAMTTIAEIIRSTPITTVCGCSKPISGSVLQCTRPAGHAGDHGMANAGVLFVRWARREEDACLTAAST